MSNVFKIRPDDSGPVKPAKKRRSALYFAYGSNLDRQQMRQRCPSALVVARGELRGYELVFGGYSHRWGGAVASIVKARGRSVPGVIYRISGDDIERLDRFEGAPMAYVRAYRQIIAGKQIQLCRAYVYIQPEDGFERAPVSRPYYDRIRRAYASLGFDRRVLARALAGGLQ